MAKNLVPNSDFELGIEGWADLGSGVTVNVLSTTTAWSPSGGKALEYKVTNSTGSAKTGGASQPLGASAPMAVKAGVTYTYKAIVNLLDAGGGTGVDLYLVWYTAAGTQVSVVEGTKTLAIGEQRLSLTATAPPTAELVSVRLRINNIANGKIGWYFLDAIEFFDASEVSELEKLIMNGFDLNDHVKVAMESLTFSPAQIRPKIAENPNSDGVLLVEEPHFTPASFEAQIRVLPKSTLAESLSVVGELVDAIQGCARTEEGAECLWTPNTLSQTYTAYALFAELQEMPITPEGDLAGWFIESPVLKIKLTCRPFLYTDERIVLSVAENSEQFQTAYIQGIKGDVPAEARMVIRDKATNARNYVEWGQDIVESESNPSIRLKATSLVITGYSGTKIVQSGSISTEVIACTLVGSPVTICSTGPIANIGTYRGKLRVKGASQPVFLRVSYRVGEGTTTSRKWVEVPVFLNESSLAQWQEIDLQELFLDEVERGEQVSEVLIQGYSDTKQTVYIDTLSLMPTKRYAVGRGKLNYTEADTISAFDQFNQISGNLATKAAEIGGTWTGAGDVDDFTVNSATHVAQRTAVSDVSGTPRYALLGTTTYSDIVVNLDISTNNKQWDENLFMGILARYVDNNNWVSFGIHRYMSEVFLGESANLYYVVLHKKIGGAKGEISNEYFLGSAIKIAVPTSTYSLKLIILANGEWKTGVGGTILATGIDSDLNTTGALRTGKIGMMDERNAATAETRTYGNFEAFVPSVGLVCNSGKAVEINMQGANRESTSGKYWSPIPTYRGSDFYLDPAGQDNLINRVAVKMRRNDININSDPNVTDKQSLEILARERFLVPR